MRIIANEAGDILVVAVDAQLVPGSTVYSDNPEVIVNPSKYRIVGGEIVLRGHISMLCAPTPQVGVATAISLTAFLPNGDVDASVTEANIQIKSLTSPLCVSVAVPFVGGTGTTDITFPDSGVYTLWASSTDHYGAALTLTIT